MSTNSVEVAPWGSIRAGKAWNFEAPAGDGIRKIKIRHGRVVDGLSFAAKTADGRLQSSEEIGGNGGQETTIVLEWPDEYLTAISGTYGDYHNATDKVITSLKFSTNYRSSMGPFGEENGTPFSLAFKRGVISGFHGRYTRYLTSIGIFART